MHWGKEIMPGYIDVSSFAVSSGSFWNFSILILYSEDNACSTVAQISINSCFIPVISAYN